MVDPKQTSLELRRVTVRDEGSEPGLLAIHPTELTDEMWDDLEKSEPTLTAWTLNFLMSDQRELTQEHDLSILPE